MACLITLWIYISTYPVKVQIVCARLGKDELREPLEDLDFMKRCGSGDCHYMNLTLM